MTHKLVQALWTLLYGGMHYTARAGASMEYLWHYPSCCKWLYPLVSKLSSKEDRINSQFRAVGVQSTENLGDRHLEL